MLKTNERNFLKIKLRIEIRGAYPQSKDNKKRHYFLANGLLEIPAEALMATHLNLPLNARDILIPLKKVIYDVRSGCHDVGIAIEFLDYEGGKCVFEGLKACPDFNQVDKWDKPETWFVVKWKENRD